MKKLRPVTKSMLQKLIECREKELNGKRDSCIMNDMSYAVAPLYKRGLIGTKQIVVNNKILLDVFVTEAGIDFLKRILKTSS